MSRPAFDGTDPAELAALYAAGALTPQECADFEQRIAGGCQQSQKAWSDVSPLVAALGSVVPAMTPDPRLRELLMARIAAQSASHAPQGKHV